MNDMAIRVENLSKRYRIGLKEELPDTIVGAMTGWLRAPLANLRGLRRLSHFSANGHDDPDVIWALKDVSFEVAQGEVMGIIGRNGAGKSTLLKILSRITEPTSGRAVINGRVSSLLEVGTGFHPELTGRENVYLNGTVLGMSKAEIDRKFDEIVDFSGVEKFIDTPVKRYSSGMQVRLAFSVAAHLEPEILLVDEVLAVGDVEFQKKCFGKMSEVSSEGRTVLFVSHNMAAIQALCYRTVVLQDSKISFDGLTEDGITHYLRSMDDLMESGSLEKRRDRVGGKDFRFRNVQFLDTRAMSPLTRLQSGRDVSIAIHYINCSDQTLKDVSLAIGFFTSQGQFLYSCRSDTIGKLFDIQPGEGTAICRILKWPLNAGDYFFNVISHMRGDLLDWIKNAGSIQVIPGDYYGTGKLPAQNRPGVFIDFNWE